MRKRTFRPILQSPGFATLQIALVVGWFAGQDVDWWINGVLERLMVIFNYHVGTTPDGALFP